MLERPQSLGEEIANAVSHGLALLAALAAVPFLIVAASQLGATSVVGACVFAATMVLLYMTSTLYHALPAGRAKRVFLKLDHGAIYLFIAGSYTPFALLCFEGTTQWLVLVLVWASAVLGLVLELAWIDSPRWLKAVAYLAVGWVGVLAAPQLFPGVGVAGAVLVIVGGGLYTLGALVYALKWPNPLPRVLGFHEVFHLLVVAAAVTQFVAVSLVVM